MKLALAILLVGCAMHIKGDSEYTQRFLTQYNKIHDSSNGYFSSEGIPYHSVETLIVEAPDHGHETTSEAYSYYIYLEAMYGAISGDFSSFNTAWEIMENYIIPSSTQQPSNSYYNPSSPATYAPEGDSPSDYPARLDFSAPVGYDPLYQELVSAYGTAEIYSMHWLQDLDNIYGFGNVDGNCEGGPDVTGPSMINTYQRGPQESVWRTIPQPTCEQFKYGGSNGFLDLFTGDNSYAHQWKFTAAPDADARAVQAAYWAAQWAREQGQLSTIESTLAKAGKLGDYLRYSFFDKYFKKIGDCVGIYNCQSGSGKDSAHYLINWYYAWGGALDGGNWAWRIGDGAAHFGYQNPLTAYALINEETIQPKGATAVSDWEISLTRQLEFYQYLQSEEGAFAGGATNSWNGRYDTPPSNLTSKTFYGMYYDWEPVYHNPPSNRWYGFQAWSVDRLAQYYYVSGDSTAKSLLDKWVAWVEENISFDDSNEFTLPSTLEWSGIPNAYSGAGTFTTNSDLHVTISSYNLDIGNAAATARALSYYAAKSGDSQSKEIAKKLLDGIWNHQDDIGVSFDETMDTYTQFNEEVYVPSGWYGTYPNGDVIQSGATFTSIRSWYKDDPNWSKVEEYLNGGDAPVFNYHRFWQQADVALAMGAYGLLFNE